MKYTTIILGTITCAFTYANVILAMHCLIPLTNRSVPLLRATALRGYCNTNSNNITLGEALIKSEQTRLARKKFVQERGLLNKSLTIKKQAGLKCMIQEVDGDANQLKCFFEHAMAQATIGYNDPYVPYVPSEMIQYLVWHGNTTQDIQLRHMHLLHYYHHFIHKQGAMLDKKFREQQFLYDTRDSEKYDASIPYYSYQYNCHAASMLKAWQWFIPYFTQEILAPQIEDYKKQIQDCCAAGYLPKKQFGQVMSPDTYHTLEMIDRDMVILMPTFRQWLNKRPNMLRESAFYVLMVLLINLCEGNSPTLQHQSASAYYHKLITPHQTKLEKIFKEKDKETEDRMAAWDWQVEYLMTFLKKSVLSYKMELIKEDNVIQQSLAARLRQTE